MYLESVVRHSACV